MSSPVAIKKERIILLGGRQHESCLEPSIRSLGFSVELAQDEHAVHSFLQTSEREIAAVIINATIPGHGGFAMVPGVRALDPHVPVIVVTRRSSIEEIVGAMKSGATDFLFSPITREVIVTVLARALENCDAGRVPKQENHDDAAGFFVGASARMAEIYAVVAQIGESKVPVLIQGETGTGKEVLARAIHSRSPRAHRPFLKLNCAALPSELVESELFGYERGAFTGAFKRKEGMFELADGGTLLLDEIGDMEVRLQAKLLQVLQDREFRRIGGKETVRVDVRIIAASHCDLEQAIHNRTFREDLYYRLNVVNLVLPPLRDRWEDIVPIAEFLVRKHATKGVSPPIIDLELRQAMMAYRWPGNIRELENYVRKLMIFHDGSLVTRELRARIARKQSDADRQSDFSVASVETARGGSALEHAARAKEQAESNAILNALNTTRWNRKQAASILGVDYKSLLYKMKKLGIENSPIGLQDRIEPVQRIRSASGD